MDSVARLVVRRQGVRCQARLPQGAGLQVRSPVLPQGAAGLQVGARLTRAVLRALLRLARRRSRALLDELPSNSRAWWGARRPESQRGSP